LLAAYGQFGAARAELNANDWSNAPAGLQSHGLQTQALIDFLSGEDAAAGLAVARQAEERANTVKLGAFASLSGMTAGPVQVCARVFVAVGELLVTGRATPELAAELARFARREKEPVLRMVAQWAAAQAYHVLGDHEASERCLAANRVYAPHCTPLLRVRPTAAAGALESQPSPVTPALAKGQGVCARHPQVAAATHCVRCGNLSCDACREPASAHAWLCADCFQRYREQRLRLLPHETRLRAFGLLIQVGAVGGLTSAVIGVPTLLLIAAPNYPGGVVSGVVAMVPGTAFMLGALMFTFLQGRWLKQMRAIQLGLVGFAIPLLLLFPFGTVLGGYLIWTLFSAGRELGSPEYQRVLAATPDIVVESPRETVLLVCVGFFVNLLALIGLLRC
jgi:hypothetical protein